MVETGAEPAKTRTIPDTGDDNAPQEVKAAYPLRAAMVNVTDDPANPGSYKATVFLKPHFQLEELTTSIRLVADLPA